MNIFKAMKPEKVYESLVHIPWEELYGSGIETALLDFDNTLGPDHATEPEEYRKNTGFPTMARTR